MGNHVLMPTGMTTQKFSGIVMTTETGAFIWDHIEAVSSAEEMAALLTEEFEVGYEEALADVMGLFNSFINAGWIEA